MITQIVSTYITCESIMKGQLLVNNNLSRGLQYESFNPLETGWWWVTQWNVLEDIYVEHFFNII